MPFHTREGKGESPNRAHAEMYNPPCRVCLFVYVCVCLRRCVYVTSANQANGSVNQEKIPKPPKLSTSTTARSSHLLSTRGRACGSSHPILILPPSLHHRLHPNCKVKSSRRTPKTDVESCLANVPRARGLLGWSPRFASCYCFYT